jgi:uncharacterized membrane protein
VLGASSLTAFTWILHTQLLRLNGLTAPSWDLGQTQQLLWSVSTGRGWASSFEYGHNFLGLHMEPVLLAVAAVERFWPNPTVPLVFAAIGLAATAPAAFLMLRALLFTSPQGGEGGEARSADTSPRGGEGGEARSADTSPHSGEGGAQRRMGRLNWHGTWLALALAAPMPFWAATQEAARDQFHPENLALALAMLAAWAGLREKRVLFWALVVAVLACKEDQTYTAFVVGFLVWRVGTPGMKQHGRRVMTFAVAWLLISVALISVLSNGAETPGLAYYWWVALPGPNYFVLAITRPDAWLMLAGLLISLLGLPMLAPRWLLLVLPPLAANLLSSHDPQQRLQQHYVLIIMFPLIVAAGIGARRLLEDRSLPTWLPAPALMALAVPAILVGFLAGRLPPALGAEQWLYGQPPAADRLLAATRVIPSGAPVFADDGAAVWLTDRTWIAIWYDQPTPDRYVVIDRLAYAHRGDRVADRTDAIAQMLASGRRLLADDGRFQVWSPAES